MITCTPEVFGPFGKSYCVLCLRSAQERGRRCFPSRVSRQYFANCDREMTVQQDAFVELACFRGFQLFLGSRRVQLSACDSLKRRMTWPAVRLHNSLGLKYATYWITGITANSSSFAAIATPIIAAAATGERAPRHTRC